jgi:uncharacterized protein YdhG (YjbR/CyaY superfamily)
MTTVNSYINQFPKQTRTILKSLRSVIKTSVPKADESISYKILSYKLNGRILIYLSANNNHIGIYPIPQEADKSVKGLSKYRFGKATLRFKYDQEIPLELFKKIVMYQLKHL